MSTSSEAELLDGGGGVGRVQGTLLGVLPPEDEASVAMPEVDEDEEGVLPNEAAQRELSSELAEAAALAGKLLLPEESVGVAAEATGLSL